MMRMVTGTFEVSLGFIHRRSSQIYLRHGQITELYAALCCGCCVPTTTDEDYIHSLIKARPSVYFNEI